MKNSISKYFAGIILITTVSLVMPGCGSLSKIQSNWSESEIKIDGDPSEWQNNAFFVKDEKVTLNFKNDDKFLYLCLITNDRGKIMQMMRSGFIVWFYPENSDSKKFGIKYPMPVSILGKDEREEFNKDLFQPDDMKVRFVKMLADANEFQIVNDDNYPLSQLPLENKEGIKVKLGYNADRFIYELQVPLESKNNYTYKIGSVPGEKLKVKFETLESEFKKMPGGGKGRGMMSPRDGDDEDVESGQRSAGRMKRAEGMNFTPPEPFNYEIVVELQKQK